MTHTFSSTIVRAAWLLEDKPLILPRTQSSGSGDGGIITASPSVPGPEDDEPRAIVIEAEKLLLRQLINRLLNVTEHHNATKPRTPLREQHGHATLDIFGAEGGAI